MDILANGDMITCQPFPEFKVGNIYTDNLQDVWKSNVFNEFRQKMAGKLMPACSKCILLYLNGY
jgi:radical SAM protein with 4Fe4S-binding SPASM domain